MPRPAKKRKSIAYGHGTISRAPNGRGYDASVYLPDGRRRARLPTLPEAKAWLDAQDPGDTISLTAAQLRDAKIALALLPTGATLTQAAQALADAASRPSSPIAPLIQAFLDDRGHAVRPATLSFYRTQLSRARKTIGDTLDAYTADALRALCDPLTPTQRNKLLRALSAFFSWAGKQDLVASNPAAKLPLARTERPRPSVLTVAQAQTLLATARDTQPDLIPYLAIGLFAGLRPDEAKRLAADDVGQAYITLTERHTKTAQARTVPIRQNLRDILHAHPIHPKGVALGLSIDRFNKRLTRLIKATGIPWANDIIRHTFATYAYDLTHDAADTAYQMGHRGTDIFFRHYRGLVPPGSSSDYFSITI